MRGGIGLAELLGLGIGAGLLVIILYILFKGIKFLKRLFSGPVSEQEALQAHFNVKAGEQPAGPGGGLKHMSGLAKVFWTIVAIGLAYLLIFHVLARLD